jgi:hypothetical protein
VDNIYHTEKGQLFGYAQNHVLSEENMKEALITGILGHDGAYLAKLLLEKGYEVHGADRLL